MRGGTWRSCRRRSEPPETTRTDRGERVRKWGLIVLVVLLVLIVGGIIGLQVGIGILKGKVVEALGPDSEIRAIRVGWSSVEVEGLRIKGQKGWPTADALQAERVAVVPSLRSLLSGQYRVHSMCWQE